MLAIYVFGRKNPAWPQYFFNCWRYGDLAYTIVLNQKQKNRNLELHTQADYLPFND